MTWGEPLRRFSSDFQAKVFLLIRNRIIVRAIHMRGEATVLTRFPEDEGKETWRGKPAKKITTFMDLAQTE